MGLWVSADVGGSGTRDDDLRTSSWEVKPITGSFNTFSFKFDGL